MKKFDSAKIQEAFKKADKDNSGYLDKTEISSACKILGLPYNDDFLQSIFQACDPHQTGKLTIESLTSVFSDNTEVKILSISMNKVPTPLMFEGFFASSVSKVKGVYKRTDAFNVKSDEELDILLGIPFASNCNQLIIDLYQSQKGLLSSTNTKFGYFGISLINFPQRDWTIVKDVPIMNGNNQQIGKATCSVYYVDVLYDKLLRYACLRKEGKHMLLTPTFNEVLFGFQLSTIKEIQIGMACAACDIMNHYGPIFDITKVLMVTTMMIPYYVIYFRFTPDFTKYALSRVKDNVYEQEFPKGIEIATTLVRMSSVQLKTQGIQVKVFQRDCGSVQILQHNVIGRKF